MNSEDELMADEDKSGAKKEISEDGTVANEEALIVGSLAEGAT